MDHYGALKIRQSNQFQKEIDAFGPRKWISSRVQNSGSEKFCSDWLSSEKKRKKIPIRGGRRKKKG